MDKNNNLYRDDYKYIPIEIILEAMQNNEKALEYIIEFYQAYINKISSFKGVGEKGKTFTILDEDKKQQIEENLIVAIRKFQIKE